MMPAPLRTGRLETSEAVARAFAVSRESRQKLEAFVALLERWNRTMNLVRDAQGGRIWSRHVADSLQLLAYIPESAKVILDIGSGAGFPGMVLAIALADRGEACVYLVESNSRKAAFLREAARTAGVAAVVHACRIEVLDVNALPAPPDVVTARALAPVDRLMALTARFVDQGAVGLFLKGQHVDIELTKASKSWSIDHELRPSTVDPGGRILIVRRARDIGWKRDGDRSA